jgi:hypothetical protein
MNSKSGKKVDGRLAGILEAPHESRERVWSALALFLSSHFPSVSAEEPYEDGTTWTTIHDPNGKIDVGAILNEGRDGDIIIWTDPGTLGQAQSIVDHLLKNGAIPACGESFEFDQTKIAPSVPDQQRLL